MWRRRGQEVPGGVEDRCKPWQGVPWNDMAIWKSACGAGGGRSPTGGGKRSVRHVDGVQADGTVPGRDRTWRRAALGERRMAVRTLPRRGGPDVASRL